MNTGFALNARINIQESLKVLAIACKIILKLLIKLQVIDVSYVIIVVFSVIITKHAKFAWITTY